MPGGNIEVTTVRTFTVPEGDYCGSCEMLQTTRQDVRWEDGLGSPGTMWFYHCEAFGVSIRNNKKCEPCLVASRCEGE